MKETCFEKYGVDNYSKTIDFKRKYKEKMIEKYGVEHYSQTDEYKIKFRDTIKKKGKCRGSKEENKIYEILEKLYPDIIRWYSVDNRYPFECDFYIPSIDVFIEYQGDWLHGRKPYNEPYDSNNINHQKILKFWKFKNDTFIEKGQKRNKYDRAIKVWTIKDPLKRETAKRNNLNYIEIFDINDIENVLTKLENIKNDKT